MRRARNRAAQRDDWLVELKPAWTKQQRAASRAEELKPAWAVPMEAAAPSTIWQIRSSWIASTTWLDFEPPAQRRVPRARRSPRRALARARAPPRRRRLQDASVLAGALEPWLEGWVHASRGCGEAGPKNRPNPKPCGVLPNALHVSDAPLPSKSACAPRRPTKNRRATPAW